MSDETPQEPTFVRITNAVVYAELQAARADLRDLVKDFTVLSSDYGATKKRLRSLELKYYGVLAGLIGALALIGSGVIVR